MDLRVVTDKHCIVLALYDFISKIIILPYVVNVANEIPIAKNIF